MQCMCIYVFTYGYDNRRAAAITRVIFSSTKKSLRMASPCPLPMPLLNLLGLGWGLLIVDVYQM